MLQVCVDNQEKYLDRKHLHKDIKRELNIGEWIIALNGEQYFKVGSVALDEMDGEDFEKYYSMAIDVCLKYVLVGTDETELNSAVNEILGFS